MTTTVDEVKAEAQAVGIDPDMAGAWFEKASQAAPQTSTLPASLIVQMLKTGKSVLDSGGFKIPTTVNPYAGTTQEARQPSAPSATALSQFDPEALKAVQGNFNQQWKGGETGRDIQNILAGLTAGFSNGRSTNDALAYQEAQRKRLLEDTIGQQKALQEQATAGTDVAGKIQNQQMEAGKFQGTQQEQQQKLTLGQMTVAQEQRMNDAKAPESILAQAMLADQLNSAGIQNPQLRDLAKSGQLTARQAMMFMTPNVLNAFKEKVGIAQAQQGVRKAAAEANQLEGANNLVGFPNGMGNGPSIGKGTGTGVSGPGLKVPSSTTELTPEQQDLRKRFQQFGNLSAGAISIPPDPRVVAGAGAEATAAANAEDRFRTYDTQLAPTIQSVKQVLQKVSPGSGTEFLSRVWPGDNRELVNMFNRFNTLYPGTLGPSLGGEMSKSIDKGGFTGSIVSNLTLDQAKRMIALIEQSAANDRNYQKNINANRAKAEAPGQTGANTPMPSTETPNTNTVRMTDGKKNYNIPANKVQDAEKDGLRRL